MPARPRSALIQCGAMILVDGRDPGSADAAGHAGVAQAITGLLRALPFTPAASSSICRPT